jgi:hypothetical protein
MAEEDKDIITTAIEFIRAIKSEDVITIFFTKADGTNRIMKCTLNFNLIPDSKKPKTVDLDKILNLLQKSKILHVYDIDKKDWRSIPLDKTKKLETKTKAYRISIK